MSPEPTPLTTEECWQHLGQEGLGRIGFNAGRGPRIHPVNYRVGDGAVYVRTAEDSELGQFARMFAAGSYVTLEADELDESSGAGWSVLVTASVELLDPGSEAPDAEPAAGGRRADHLKLTPNEVTGRRLSARE